MIRTQTFIDEWLEEAEQKGHQEGRQEAKYEALVQFLTYKFTVVPPELLHQLQKLSAAALSTLFNQALTAQTLTEIETVATSMAKAAAEATDDAPSA